MLVQTLCFLLLLLTGWLPAAEPIPQVLYLYGDVSEDGDIPSGAKDPFHQMRLGDTGKRGMSQFRDAIIEAGFTIEEAYDADTTLDASLLDDYAVLILGSNQKTFSADEATAVDAWVRAGGGLIAYSDSAFGGLYSIVGVGNPKGKDSNNIITMQFGMEFMRDNGAGNYLVDQYEFDHYLNRFDADGGLAYRGEGVSCVRVSAPAVMLARLQEGGLGGRIRLHKDDPEYDAAIDAALAIASVGEGRVVGTFDRNTFWNAGEGTRLSHEDNRLFTQRMVWWVSGLDSGNEPPSVQLTAPEADLMVEAPATIGLSAIAGDNDGSVTLVEFLNGDSVIGSVENEPYTMTWGDVEAGVYSIRARATDDEGATAVSTARSITVTGSPTPFGGTPWPIPGRVQFQDFDDGGPGTAYVDSAAGNAGNSNYRSGEDVDVQDTDDESGERNIGWTAAGEWLCYTVQVTRAGTYDLRLRVASENDSESQRRLRLELDGESLGDLIQLPSTGGWQQWTTYTVSGLELPAGEQRLHMLIEAGDVNLNWFEFIAQADDRRSIVLNHLDDYHWVLAPLDLEGIEDEGRSRFDDLDPESDHRFRAITQPPDHNG